MDGVFKQWTVQENLAEPSATVSLDATPKETEGCLAFNWEKKSEGEENPKENNLRFVWSLSKGNTGFAVYVSGTVTDVEKDKIKVTFEGAAYVFKKNNDKWEVSSRLELKKDSQTLEQTTDIAGKFPKLAAAMKGKLEGLKDVEGDYWGFLDNDGQKLGASAEKTNYGYGKWTGKKDGGENLKDWTSNLDAWWSHFFDKSKWDMVNLMNDIKGSWSRE